MEKNDTLYQTYLRVLKKELIPAMGCTEPIAISLAAARAREILGLFPDQVIVRASGNIIKNVKSVTVPNTGGLKGIEAAAAAGIIAGDSGRLLEVINHVSEEDKQNIRELLKKNIFKLEVAQSKLIFDIIVILFAGKNYSKVRIANKHSNIVLIEKNGERLLDIPVPDIEDAPDPETALFTVEGILDFADSVDIEDVREILQRQIDYNIAISEEGMNNDWGANIGRVIMKNGDSNDAGIRAKAMAAAGSDARMSGCELPVVINSGSGNQGITASVPVIVFAREINASEEKLYRALVLSNLLGIHQKTGIGRLSAYCGAVSAGCASSAAISYLYGGGKSEIEHVLVNALAIASGIICDGAKPSCAAKIATAVDAGILGYLMTKENQQFRDGDGIVKKGVENTILNVGKLGRNGMKETDKEILRIMID